MAWEERVHAKSYQAASDLSASQYCFVSLNSSNQVALATAGSMPIGVMLDKPAAQGRVTAVGAGGTVKVLCGGTVTKGGPVSVGTAGKARDALSGDFVIGVARETGASGAIIAMDWSPRAGKL